MAKFILVASKKDPASENMKKLFLELFDWEVVEKFEKNDVFYSKELDALLVTTEKDTVYCDDAINKFDGDFYIILSRHSGKGDTPTISTHATGNFGENTLGGYPKTLSIALPIFMKEFLTKANELSEGYDVKQEVTHHGPTLEKRIVFVETGPSEKEWNDKKAIEVVVESTIYAMKNMKKDSKVAVGFGGPHYSYFTRFVLKEGIAFGHILPKYQQENIDEEIVRKMIEKNYPKPKFVYVHKKGLNSEYRKKLLEILEELDLEVVKV